MESKQAGMSRDEIWDDSALIDSWNEALDEYKKYHSVHARGGTLQDLQDLKQSKIAAHSQVLSSGSGIGETGAEGDQHMSSREEGEADDPPLLSNNDKPNRDTTPATGMTAFPGPAVLGSIRDENLKKLLMSWYYAGYYTGLFEGQQQAQADGHPGNS